MKLVTASEMRELDRTAIQDYGIPGIVLMENAGRGTVDFLHKHLGNPAERSVIIFCGPGNNGGDGLVIARTLHQLGAHPYIYFLIDPARLKGDAALNYRIVRKLFLPMTLVDTQEKLKEAEQEIISHHGHRPSWAIVDSIFGTGLARDVGGHFLDCVNLINRLRSELAVPVAAVDIASGIGSDDGRILGGCVWADYTATYGLAKPGHFLQNGAECTGRLKVIDISIPPKAVEDAKIKKTLLDRGSISALIRNRSLLSHKGSHGHLLILAGSSGKTGAAILSASGALRSGAGLVTLGVPHSLNHIFETTLSEAMTVPLPASNTVLSVDDFELILELLKGKNGVVIGPGLGTDETTKQLVVKLYQEVALPMVIDADGLNILAEFPKILRKKTVAARILTPHPGEMSRLINTGTREIQTDRLRAAAWLADVPEIITVLKGAGTVISAPDGALTINSTGNSGMATGGMGDVLSGLIGGLVVQGYSPWDASCLGVYVHGLAADRLARQQKYGYLASEVAAQIPSVLTKLDKNFTKGKKC